MEKRGRARGTRIHYNKKLLFVIILLTIIFLMLIYFITQNKGDDVGDYDADTEECYTNNDCVPASCCHAEKCTSKSRAPDCQGIFCTQVCLGPLDCGAGSCSCINNKCQVVSVKNTSFVSAF